MAKNRYVPTTEDVSRRYMFGCWEEYNDTSGDYRAEFDRWLAEVKESAWEEGWSSGYKFRAAIWETTNQPKKINPYRQVKEIKDVGHTVVIYADGSSSSRGWGQGETE